MTADHCLLTTNTLCTEAGLFSGRVVYHLESAACLLQGDFDADFG